MTIPVIPVEHTNPPGAVLWQRWTPEGRHRTGAGRERDAALRSWRGYGILRESAFLVYTTSMYGRSAVNRPIISQTSSAVEVSRSLDAQASLLRVYTFGAFRLAWQVPPCTTEDLWKSRTAARTLFKVLLCAPGRQASRSQLAGMLWPETDEDKARESLRSASKVLRKVLRTAGGEDLLENRNTPAILGLAEQSRLWVDADAFLEVTSQASRATAPEEALALWQQAQDLLHGEFLADDLGGEWMRHRWIKLRQQALRMARGRMVRHLSDLYLQQGQISLAEEVLEEHLIRFPTDQDALYRLLVLLEQQSCFEAARLVYERAKQTLAALGKQPAPQVRTQYERLLIPTCNSRY